ncbi:SNF2 domain-containing protein [Actinidia rufa]|uniref:SNF2 domain-containing protein n=1 Tax=Actinidia rufa TaxID=165716 RepID=A0A7J0F0W2_9ERIC|nr:SNF2 domain-containing protein [Actinidia rufa]
MHRGAMKRFSEHVSVRLSLKSVTNCWCIGNESLGNKMVPPRKIVVTDMSVFLFIQSCNMSLDAIILIGGLVNMLTITVTTTSVPPKNCKARLILSAIFSKDTLKNALSEQSVQDSTGSEVSDKLEPGSWGQSFYSSKIKAALEVLQSLSKPSHCTPGTSSLKSIDESATCPENSSDPLSRWLELDERNLDLDKGLNDLIKYRRLDGTMSVVARDKAVKDFNALPEVSVMIMSLKAASLGLNMVAACRVILLDLWWNPTTEDQAIDRAHRIGQTRPVTVLRLTVKDTVEDRILALQQRKRVMVASAFGEDDKGSRQTRLTEEDLKYLFMV